MRVRKKLKNQLGQTAVFFALLLPVLILFLFVVFDLGWLYLNNSRLQNAAEAAAIAGANKFCAVSQEGYNNVMLIYKINSEVDKGTAPSNEVNNAAKLSWSDNLGFSADSATDSWTNSDVTPAYKIYKDKTNEKFYYEVELTEEVGHIFKFLDDVISTKVPAVAVAEITKVGERNLWSDMVKLDTTHVVGNWEEQDAAQKTVKNSTAEEKANFSFYSYPERRTRYYYDGVWNHYQDTGTPTDPNDVNSRRDAKAQVHYDAGNVYKYENVVINPSAPLKDDAKKTSANGSEVYDANLVDSLNLDFRQDVTLSFTGELTGDWDIGFDLTGTGIDSVSPTGSNYRTGGWGANEINLRTHATFNFNEPFTTRTEISERVKQRYAHAFGDENITSPDSDPLYVHIESEPMSSQLYGKAPQKGLNSVRQIILNFNETNMDTADNEKIHDYKYRPYVIFYDGPEKNDLNSKRESQPVIVNLNADFRGILFMPNSPVVINGNGKKFQGFVIAKEFVKLKTESDYAYHYKRDGDNKDIYFDNKNAPTTKPASGDDWIMVKKNDGTSTDWFKVEKSKLLYTSEYAKITVEDSAQATLNGNAYTFKYTQKNYAVKRSKLDDSNSFIDGKNYDTTTYYRRKEGSNEKATPAYIRSDLKKYDTITGEKDSNGIWIINNTTIPNDAGIIPGRISGWYEVRTSESKNDIWSVRDGNNNYLFYKDGWRLITDENGNKKFAKSGTITANCVDLSTYVEVIDAEGKTAYTHKDNVKSTNEVYLKLTNAKTDANDIIYINKTTTNYYIKKSEDELLILDLNGNVQYTDAISPTTTYDFYNGDWKDGFKPADFNLKADKADTHYSRCGAVPTRRRYSALDAFEEDDGAYCQDMFFTTARSKYVI